MAESEYSIDRKEEEMKKLKGTKLTLSKETLRSLENHELPKALGGNTLQLCTEGTFACSFCRTC